MNETGSSLTPLRREDYEAIEAAVMETARGRWFLAEYARRHRTADTTVVLEAIGKLEKIVKRERAVPDVDRIRLDLSDMAHAIHRTKEEIAQIRHHADDNGKFARATDELDAIVNQTENATSDILTAAEQIQERAWTLREAGADTDGCDNLDALATEIYTACSFQDLTGQRTQKVVHVLKYLEGRIGAMTEIWGIDELPQVANPGIRPGDTRAHAHLLNGPQLDGEGAHQTDNDALMAHEGDLADFVTFDPVDTSAGNDIEFEEDGAVDFGEAEALAVNEAEAEFAEEMAEAEEAAAAEDVVEAEEIAEAEDVAVMDLDAPGTMEEIDRHNPAAQDFQSDIGFADDDDIVASETVDIDEEAPTSEADAEGESDVVVVEEQLDAEWAATESAPAAGKAKTASGDDPTAGFTPSEKTALFV